MSNDNELDSNACMCASVGNYSLLRTLYLQKSLNKIKALGKKNTMVLEYGIVRTNTASAIYLHERKQECMKKIQLTLSYS